VALGYPCYFVLRRKLGTASLGGLWLDLVISLPVAALFAFSDRDTLQQLAASPALLFLIIGLGALSALALALMIVASKHLDLALFGLLSYVEPVLLVVVALLLGESIAADQWLTYGAIWTAIALLIVEGAKALRAARAGVPQHPPAEP
jgi:chloramphenicol-sensitive protein RarD